MRQIQMQFGGNKYILPPGVSVVGNSERCEIKIANICDECFVLNNTEYILWIEPLTNIERINGFNEKYQLSLRREYEIDITTGPKQYVINESIVEFIQVYPKQTRIKVNIIKTRSQEQQQFEPPKEKKVKLNPKRSDYKAVWNYIKNVKEYRVKFSNFSLSEDDAIKLFKIGIIIDSSDYNILIMDGFKRTFNLLLAIQEGKLVVSSSWIMSCLSSMTIENPYLYILKTNKFSLLKSINKAMENPLFRGQSYMVSKHSQNGNLSQDEVKQLIEAGHGIYGPNGKVIGEKGSIEWEQFIESILYQQL